MQSSAENDATKQEHDTKAAAIWQGDPCLTWCYQGSKSHDCGSLENSNYFHHPFMLSEVRAELSETIPSI